MEGLLIKKDNEKNRYKLQEVVLKSRGRDAVLEAIEGQKWVESYPMFPDYYVWVEEDPSFDEETFELTLGDGIGVTVWKNILITRGDGDTNPKSLTLEDFRILKKNLKMDNQILENE